VQTYKEMQVKKKEFQVVQSFSIRILLEEITEQESQEYFISATTKREPGIK
jgi:hypothetical protein